MRSAAALAGALVLGCGSGLERSAYFSFEGSLQGWTPQGTDLTIGSAIEAWSIEPSSDRAFEGSGSAKLFLDNQNAMGKVWLERTFPVTPGKRYRAHLELALGTADATGSGRLIAGVLQAPPRSATDLTAAVREDTSNRGAQGYAWISKSYDVDAQIAETGSLTALIGVWGTSGTPRTYYLDTVAVVLIEE